MMIQEKNDLVHSLVSRKRFLTLCLFHLIMCSKLGQERKEEWTFKEGIV